MITKENAVYLQDSYLKELETTVKEVNRDKFIVLEKTLFYPNSGGQPHDLGKIVKNGLEFNVVYAGKFNDQISHEVDQPGLKAGDKVRCVLDWKRRYKLMCMHTAAHVLSAVIKRETGALITGNQLDTEKSRIDFSLEKFDKEKFIEFVDRANKIIHNDLPVKIKFINREELEKSGGVKTNLEKGLPPEIKEIRLVDIVGLEEQADGGTHVKHLGEIGQLKFVGAENKGASRRRVYYEIM